MNSSYVVSKIGWSALSRVQQRALAADSRPDIVVNHVHPGYVDTDMTRLSDYRSGEMPDSAV